jgi:predicted ester cyclase
MTTEDEKTKNRRRIEEVFNKGNMDLLEEAMVPDVVYHIPPRPDIKGLKAYKQYITDFRKALSGFHFALHEFVTDGDIEAGRYTITGTHTGQLPGSPVPPTGKQVTLAGVYIGRKVNGKFVEQWNYADMLGFMQQLGVMPPTGSAG